MADFRLAPVVHTSSRRAYVAEGLILALGFSLKADAACFSRAV